MRRLLWLCSLLFFTQFGPFTAQDTLPNSPTLSSLACVDSILSSFLRSSGHNAASFSVMRNGTIAYSQGYGFAAFDSTRHNFRQVGADGWCTSESGGDSTARYYFDGRLQYDGAVAICNHDPGCVAFSYLNASDPDRIVAAFYTSTDQCRMKGGLNCDSNQWSMNASLITGSSGAAKWSCRVKGAVNATVKAQRAVRSTPFRWGSVSKSVSAAAFMVLVQKGLVSLDTFAFRCGDGIVGPLAYLAFNTSSCTPRLVLGDSRIPNITMRHLLQHTSGWDPDAVQQANVAHHFQNSTPSMYWCRETCPDVVEFILTQPLGYAPGSRGSYFNPGYCAVGLAIQSVFSASIGGASVSYEDAVRALLLKPAGISASEMYLRSRDSSIAAAVGYCNASYCWAGVWDCLHGPSLMERWGPHGGWIASATAIMKIMRVITAPYCRYSAFGCLLNATSMASLLAPPPGISVSPTQWYGLGFDVMASQDSQSSFDSRHGGAMPGTSTTFFRFADWHKPGWYAAALSVHHLNADIVGTVDQMNPLISRALDCVSDATWKELAENGSISGDDFASSPITTSSPPVLSVNLTLNSSQPTPSSASTHSLPPQDIVSMCVLLMIVVLVERCAVT